MSNHSEACRAHALHCFEVASNTHTPEDRREFLSFAESWQRLAAEIEQNERLIGLIEELTENIVPKEDRRNDGDELTDCERSGARSLRRLAAAIVSISDHVATEAVSHLHTLKKVAPSGRSPSA